MINRGVRLLLGEQGRERQQGAKMPETERQAANRVRLGKMAVAGVYPAYLQKAAKKGRSADEVEAVVVWLTGYTPDQLRRHLDDRTSFEVFFRDAPRIHPNVDKITGVVCGVRVEEVEDPLMHRIRQLDKLVDELAKGVALGKILRA
jgi:hypothetical protein